MTNNERFYVRKADLHPIDAETTAAVSQNVTLQRGDHHETFGREQRRSSERIHQERIKNRGWTGLTNKFWERFACWGRSNVPRQ